MKSNAVTLLASFSSKDQHQITHEDETCLRTRLFLSASVYYIGRGPAFREFRSSREFFGGTNEKSVEHLPPNRNCLNF